jgi:hypothetical protein
MTVSNIQLNNGDWEFLAIRLACHDSNRVCAFQFSDTEVNHKIERYWKGVDSDALNDADKRNATATTLVSDEILAEQKGG